MATAGRTFRPAVFFVLAGPGPISLAAESLSLSHEPLATSSRANPGSLGESLDSGHRRAEPNHRLDARRANRGTAARALERLTDTSARVPALESSTKRELEIVDGVALGLHNKDIAQQFEHQ
jgi:ATP/maltotriose-dependent transcriptional regulator MalT